MTLSRMACAIHLSLEPGEAPVCVSNCNSSFVTMTVMKRPSPMSSPAMPLKSPCACRLDCAPCLTQLIELSLRLTEGSALQAEPLAMRSKALPFLRQIRRWDLPHGLEYLGLC